MGFVDMDDQALARTSALNVAVQNEVWDEAPDVTPDDITFPECPPGSPGAGSNACIRVDVFRNQRAGGNPLPTFFARLVGVNEQGVRATATAEVLFGDSTDCVKPFAIADKWLEQRNDQGPPGWSETDTFERYVQNGQNRGQLLSPADYYEAPGAPGGSYGPNGTGFTRDVHRPRRQRSRPPHRAQGRQPQSGHRSRLVSPGRDQSVGRSGRRQLPRATSRPAIRR